MALETKQAFFFENWAAQRLGPGPETHILSELPSSLRANVSVKKLKREERRSGCDATLQRALVCLFLSIKMPA